VRSDLADLGSGRERGRPRGVERTGAGELGVRGRRAEGERERVRPGIAAFEPDDETAAPDIQRLSHRQFYPRELEALLHYNGFAIETLQGGFLREPFDAASESQVIVAKRR